MVQVAAPRWEDGKFIEGVYVTKFAIGYWAVFVTVDLLLAAKIHPLWLVVLPLHIALSILRRKKPTAYAGLVVGLAAWTAYDNSPRQKRRRWLREQGFLPSAIHDYEMRHPL